MGYRSMFRIEAEWCKEFQAFSNSTGIPVKEIVSRIIDRVSQYSFEDEATKSPLSHIFYNESEIKWYNWDDDMVVISRELPSILFTVTMDGEDSDDFRQLVAKDGEVAIGYGKVTYWHDPENAKLRDEIIARPGIISPKQFIIER